MILQKSETEKPYYQSRHTLIEYYLLYCINYDSIFVQFTSLCCYSRTIINFIIFLCDIKYLKGKHRYFCNFNSTSFPGF